MKTNHDGTITLNAYDTWTSCVACGQRVTGDSIHTCSPQLKTLTDDEMLEVYKKVFNKKNEFKENLKRRSYFDFARAILKKARNED